MVENFNCNNLLENLITALEKINNILIGGYLIEVATIHQYACHSPYELNKYLNIQQFANFIVTCYIGYVVHVWID